MLFSSLRGAPRSLVAGIVLAIAVTAGFAIVLIVLVVRDDRGELELVLTALTGHHIVGVVRGRPGAPGKLTRLFAFYSVCMGLATAGLVAMKGPVPIVVLAGTVFLADLAVVVLLTMAAVDRYRSIRPLGPQRLLPAH